MPDLEALNGVASADIEAINGVAKSSVEAVNGNSVVSGSTTATRWVAGFDGLGSDWYISFATPDDLSASVWEDNMYTAVSGSSPDTYELAYGKDSTGTPLWVAAVYSGNPEIIHDDDNDVTDGASWTGINLSTPSAAKPRTIVWGENGDNNSCFAAIGKLPSGNQYVSRSEGGTSWSQIDISSSCANLSTTVVVYGLATDGLGVWMFAQEDRLYISTDNASSWAQFQDGGSDVIPSANAVIQDIVYTNDSWVILMKWDDSGGDGTRMFLQSCAASDRTDWGTPLKLKDSTASGQFISNSATKMTGVAGKLIVHDSANIQAATVSGKTLTLVGDKVAPPDSGTLYCIGFDGTTLLTGSQGTSGGGDISKAPDWPPTNFGSDPVAEGINHSGDRRVMALMPNLHFPR